MAAAAVFSSAPDTEGVCDSRRLSLSEMDGDDGDVGCVLACLLWVSILAMLLLESWPALVVLASLVVLVLCGGDGRRRNRHAAPPLPHPNCKSHPGRRRRRRRDAPASSCSSSPPPLATYAPPPPPPPMAPTAAETPPPTWSSDLYEVRPTSSPERGLGVFARRAIRRGTRVIAEAPLFAVPSAPEEVVAAVSAAVGQLEPADRAAYRACHAYRGPSEHEAAAAGRDLLVFRSNAYTVPGGRWAMFLRLARVNHSCKPNVANAWDAARAEKVLWAVRDIAAGEEVCVTYVRLLQERDQRRHRLAQYGFLCACEACLGDGVVGDAARVRAGELMEELDRASGRGAIGEDGGGDGHGGGDEALLGKAEELARILEDQGLGDYLARAYRHAADLSARMGRLAEAADWAAKEVEILGFVSDG